MMIYEVVWVRWITNNYYADGPWGKWHAVRNERVPRTDRPAHPDRTLCGGGLVVEFEHERVLERPRTPEGVWPPVTCARCESTLGHLLEAGEVFYNTVEPSLYE